MGWSGGGEVRAAPSRDLCDQSPHLQLHRILCKILETIRQRQNIRGPSKVAADGGGIFVGQIRSSNPFSNKCENRIGKERVGKWEKEFRYVRNVTRYEKRYRIAGIISTIISTSRGSHTTVRPSLHNCFVCLFDIPGIFWTTLVNWRNFYFLMTKAMATDKLFCSSSWMNQRQVFS